MVCIHTADPIQFPIHATDEQSYPAEGSGLPPYKIGGAAAMLAHCARQLDRLIPNWQPQMHAQYERPCRHSVSAEQGPALRLNAAQPAVQLRPQLPALLALSLALVRRMHSTLSMTEPGGETCFQSLVSKVHYMVGDSV